MEISKTNLLMLLCDAYQYHNIKYHDRRKKDYKTKTKREFNNELVNFHDYKKYEIDRLMEEIKKSNNINIKNDYKD